MYIFVTAYQSLNVVTALVVFFLFILGLYFIQLSHSSSAALSTCEEGNVRLTNKLGWTWLKLVIHWNSSVSAGTRWISISVWPPLLVRSQLLLLYTVKTVMLDALPHLDDLTKADEFQFITSFSRDWTNLDQCVSTWWKSIIWYLMIIWDFCWRDMLEGFSWLVAAATDEYILTAAGDTVRIQHFRREGLLYLTSPARPPNPPLEAASWMK